MSEHYIPESNIVTRITSGGRPRVESIHFDTIEFPVELLCEIFFYFCYDNNSSRYAPYLEPSPNSGPLLLCQVCGQWREIAICTPQLWTSLYIHKLNPALPLLKLWIERSRDHPFSFFWNFGTRYALAATNNCRPFHGYKNQVESLLYRPDLVRRWNDVCFYAPEKEAEEVVQHEYRFQLRDNMLMTHRAWQSLPRIHNSSNLPPISTLLTRKTFLWTAESFDMPRIISLRQTHIKISTKVSLYGCLALLSSCTDAVEVTIDWLEDPGSISFGTTPPIRHLPKLESLIINAAPFDVTLLLDCLVCRKLRILRLGTTNSQTRSPLRLSNFLIRGRSVNDSTPGIASLMKEVVLVDYRLGLGIIGCLSLGVLRTLDTVLVFPGPMSAEETVVVKTRLEGLTTQKGCRHFIADVTDPGRTELGSCHWFGWVRKDSGFPESR